MIRIIIEIDDKQVSFTTAGPTAGQTAAPAPPPELLARGIELGATSAGRAPGEANAAVDLASATAGDAGSAPEADTASSRPGEESKFKRTSK
jgi:hypothetical protein